MIYLSLVSSQTSYLYILGSSLHGRALLGEEVLDSLSIVADLDCTSQLSTKQMLLLFISPHGY
jgi:hypothetical protein